MVTKRPPAPATAFVLMIIAMAASLGSCNTEATWLQWDFPWISQRVPCKEGLLDTTDGQTGASSRSFLLSDGSLCTIVLRRPSTTSSDIRVIVWDSSWNVVMDFVSTRLGSQDLSYSWVDETGGIHLWVPWNTLGEYLVPGSPWTRSSAGDAATYSGETYRQRRIATPDDSTMLCEIHMVPSGSGVDIRLDYSLLSHDPDPSLGGSQLMQVASGSLTAWSDVLNGQIRDFVPDAYDYYLANYTEADLYSAINSDSNLDSYLQVDAVTCRYDPDLVNGRTLVQILCHETYTASGYGSQLFELEFPVVLASDSDAAAVYAAYPGKFTFRIRNQARVLTYTDSYSAFDSYNDSAFLSKDGLMVARYRGDLDGACYMVWFANDSDARHDKLLLLPRRDYSGSGWYYRLPFPGAGNGTWLTWDTDASTLSVHVPWWEGS